MKEKSTYVAQKVSDLVRQARDVRQDIEDMCFEDQSKVTMRERSQADQVVLMLLKLEASMLEGLE